MNEGYHTDIPNIYSNQFMRIIASNGNETNLFSSLSSAISDGHSSWTPLRILQGWLPAEGRNKPGNLGAVQHNIDSAIYSCTDTSNSTISWPWTSSKGRDVASASLVCQLIPYIWYLIEVFDYCSSRRSLLAVHFMTSAHNTVDNESVEDQSTEPNGSWITPKLLAQNEWTSSDSFPRRAIWFVMPLSYFLLLSSVIFSWYHFFYTVHMSQMFQTFSHISPLSSYIRCPDGQSLLCQNEDRTINILEVSVPPTQNPRDVLWRILQPEWGAATYQTNEHRQMPCSSPDYSLVSGSSNLFSSNVLLPEICSRHSACSTRWQVWQGTEHPECRLSVTASHQEHRSEPHILSSAIQKDSSVHTLWPSPPMRQSKSSTDLR